MVTVMVMVGRSKSSSDPSVYQSLVNDKGEQIELFPDFPLGIPDPVSYQLSMFNYVKLIFFLAECGTVFQSHALIGFVTNYASEYHSFEGNIIGDLAIACIVM